MTKLIIGDESFSCNSFETVLDTLLRNKVDVAYACRKGTCHSCMLKSLDAPPPPVSTVGLKNTLKKQNYFLSCRCVPLQDMTLKLPDQSDFYTEGEVVCHEMLNRNTLLLIVQCRDVLEYYAGQFVNLQRDDGLTRSYSIANVPRESGELEFHIRLLPGGRFSEWAHRELRLGDRLLVSEPKGHCFYLPERREQGILLVGTGSGLAPLAGILTDALAHGHCGPIHLFHGSREAEGLYRIDEMRKLAAKHANFHYIPCISSGRAADGIAAGRANEVAMNAIPDLTGWRVFLCGHPEMISHMKREAFLKGASMADIYSDAFHVSTI
ncbi:MAG: FAD-binding oxidoreductase [Gammaproteobacteria bacterium]